MKILLRNTSGYNSVSYKLQLHPIVSLSGSSKGDPVTHTKWLGRSVFKGTLSGTSIGSGAEENAAASNAVHTAMLCASRVGVYDISQWELSILMSDHVPHCDAAGGMLSRGTCNLLFKQTSATPCLLNVQSNNVTLDEPTARAVF